MLELVRRPVTVAERMVAILDLLANGAPVTFAALFPLIADRSVVVTTFLALLELLRQGTVRVRQPVLFGEIVIVGAAT